MRNGMKVCSAIAAAVMVLQAGGAHAQQPRNVVLFIADGLRALSVTPQSAPTFAAVRDEGVNLANPHALFPTFTMPNSSAMATGHYLGDTGVFSNWIFIGYPVPQVGNSVTPFIENDAVLGDIDVHFGGSFISEETILAAARHQGLSTAAIGKLGPTLLFDHGERSGEHTIIFDDWTGTANGIPLSAEIKDKLAAAGLATTAPTRGENGTAGDYKTPGTLTANTVQQAYFADVAA